MNKIVLKSHFYKRFYVNFQSILLEKNKILKMAKTKCFCKALAWQPFCLRKNSCRKKTTRCWNICNISLLTLALQYDKPTSVCCFCVAHTVSKIKQNILFHSYPLDSRQFNYCTMLCAVNKENICWFTYSETIMIWSRVDPQWGWKRNRACWNLMGPLKWPLSSRRWLVCFWISKLCKT